MLSWWHRHETFQPYAGSYYIRFQLGSWSFVIQITDLKEPNIFVRALSGK
jgi:hypothetical protein